MKKTFGIIVFFVAAFTSLTGAWASAIQWSENGHWYEAFLVPSGITWDEAKTEAEAKGGYLATATSSAENEFIFGLIDSPQFWFMDTADNNEGPWLGGYWEGGSWKWVTGEVWSWTNWDNWEPNNIGVETRLNFFSNDASASNQIRESYWNNVGPTSEMKGYIVEFDRNPVPIPGAVWLLGSGLIGLIGLRRRFT